jgi:ABC-type transporter Mla MlaB component
VRPVGGLVASAVQLFAAVLADTYFQGHTSIELDLSEVVGCDAAGLDALAAAHRYVQGCGKELRFRGAPEWLREQLDMVGLPTGVEIAGAADGSASRRSL